MTPQRALCVHLMRELTLKGKDNTSIYFMCLTMIDPTNKLVQHNIATDCHKKLTVPNKSKGKKATYKLT